MSVVAKYGEPYLERVNDFSAAYVVISFVSSELTKRGSSKGLSDHPTKRGARPAVTQSSLSLSLYIYIYIYTYYLDCIISYYIVLDNIIVYYIISAYPLIISAPPGCAVRALVRGRGAPRGPADPTEHPSSRPSVSFTPPPSSVFYAIIILRVFACSIRWPSRPCSHAKNEGSRGFDPSRFLFQRVNLIGQREVPEFPDFVEPYYVEMAKPVLLVSVSNNN